jgi:hypothetical protein
MQFIAPKLRTAARSALPWLKRFRAAHKAFTVASILPTAARAVLDCTRQRFWMAAT